MLSHSIRQSRFGIGASLSALFHLITLTLAQQAGPDPVSVFTLPTENNSGNYTFAVNVPSGGEAQSHNDLYFHLSGPSDYSWVAVGTGTGMKNSLMFILYSNAHGDGVTLSPRWSSDTTEPVFQSTYDVQVLSSSISGGSNGILSVNAKCSNCTQWSNGALDVTSTTQPWIFALGPTSSTSVLVRSDSPSVSIERHSEYGRFTMDMVHATGGSGGLPNTNSSMFSTTVGASLSGSTYSDSNWPSIIHALLLCGAFVLLMPTGVIFLRVIPQSVRWHWVNQTLAAALAIIGGLGGLYLSTMFTKSHSYNSAHQLVGIFVILAVIVQWGLGFWHHRQYKLTQSPTKYGPIHRYFGQAVVLLGVLNGGIGLTWSAAARPFVIAYAVVVAIVGVGVIAAVVWKRFGARSRQPGKAWSSSRSGPLAYGHSDIDESQVQLTQYPGGQYDRLQ